MSAIFCKKISLHKIKKILYDKKHEKLIFKFQIPIQKKYFCQFSDIDFVMPVGNLDKAMALGKRLPKLKKEEGDSGNKNRSGDDNH